MRYFLFVSLFSLTTISCSFKASESSHDDLTFFHQTLLKGGTEIMEFKIVNNTDSAIRLIDPYNIHVEKYDQDNWIRLRTLDCPCGASCPPPPKEFYVKNGEEHKLNWNKKEEWCGPKKVGGRPPEAFSEEVKKGLYRIRVSVSDQQGKPQFIYYQFEIE